MELNREQIIKGLECCTRGVDADGTPPCDECPYDWCNIVGGDDVRQRTGSCQYWLKVDALAIIRELTKEKERLEAQREIWKATAYCEKERADIIKRDTVRKMQERLHDNLHDIPARSFIHAVIDQIAREMMEENNG